MNAGPFLFLLSLVGMWIAVSFAASRSGWRSFSSRYPAPTRPPGRAYASSSSRFGNVFGSYRNVVRVVFSDAGIYCYAVFLFRAFHPPFLVPWESVQRVEKNDGIFSRGYRLEIEDAAGRIRIQLPRTVEDDLFKYRKAA